MRNRCPQTTVLLGDSARICSAGLAKLLSDDFTIVGSAHDGGELIARALESHPDVVVTDVLLRFRDPEDAVRQIKERCPAVKIVILTDRRDAWSARQSLEAGGSAYILKQDAPEDLISAIAAAARGEPGVVSPILTGAVDNLANQRMGLLTPRQTQVLCLLAEGKTSKEIAAIIDVSTRTVEFHKYELMRRLAVRSSTELMAVAARHGLIRTDEPMVNLLPSKV